MQFADKANIMVDLNERALAFRTGGLRDDDDEGQGRGGRRGGRDQVGVPVLACWVASNAACFGCLSQISALSCCPVVPHITLLGRSGWSMWIHVLCSNRC
jgi:hypothetical protein